MKKQILNRTVSMLLTLVMVLALPAGALLEVRAAEAQTESTETAGNEPAAVTEESQEPQVQKKQEASQTQEVKTEASEAEETKTEETKTEAPEAEQPQEQKTEAPAVYVDKDGKYLAPEQLTVYVTAGMEQEKKDAAPKAQDLDEQYTGVVAFYDYNETNEEKRLDQPYFFYYEDGKLQDEKEVFASAKGWLDLVNAPVAEQTVNDGAKEDRLVYVAAEVYLDQEAQEHPEYLFAFNRKDDGANDLFTGSYDDKNYADGLGEEASPMAADGAQSVTALAPEESAALAVPAVTVTKGTNQVVIRWNQVEHAEQYIVKRSENGGDWTDIAVTEELTYTDITVQNGCRYFYTVQAKNTQTSSEFEDRRAENKGCVSFYTVPKVTVKARETGALVSWTADSTAVGYRVFRKAVGEKNWTVVKNITNGATKSYLDTSAPSGKKLSYAVRAYYGDPANLAADTVYSDSVWSGYKASSAMYFLCIQKWESTGKGLTVKWKAASGVSGYQISYRTSPNGKWVSNINVGNKTSYTLTNLKNGQKYDLALRAYTKSKSGKITYTSWVKPVEPCVYHAKLKVSLGVHDKGVSIVWSLDSRAVGYRIFRKANGKSTILTTIPASAIKGGASTGSYWDLAENLTNGTSYEYAVRAYYGTGDVETIPVLSDVSNWGGYVWNWVKYLETPVLRSAANDYSGSKITWNANKAATGYVIYRKTGTAGKWTSVGKVTNGTTNYFVDTSVSKLKSGQELFYTVRAYYKDTKSLSGYQTAGIGLYYLAKPDNLKVGQPRSSGTVVTWSAVRGAEEYEVYHRVGRAGKWTLLGTVTGTRFVDYDVVKKNAKGDYYAVRALATHEERTVKSTYERFGATYGLPWAGKERNQWVKKNQNTYYVDGNGMLLTDWQYLKRNGRTYKYYFDKNTGALVTNLYSYFGVEYRDKNFQVEVYLDSGSKYGGHTTIVLYDEETKSYCIPAVTFRVIANLEFTTARHGVGSSYMSPGAGEEEFVQLVKPNGGFERYATRVNVSPSYFHSVIYRRPSTYGLRASTYNGLANNKNNSSGCIRCQAIYSYLIQDLMKNGYGKNHRVRVEIRRYAKDLGPFGIPKIKEIKSSQNYDPTDPAYTGKFFYATQLKEGDHYIKAQAGAQAWEWYD